MVEHIEKPFAAKAEDNGRLDKALATEVAVLRAYKATVDVLEGRIRGRR